jgi:hypothetical protein
MAAKTFASTEEAQANYDAIAKGLLTGDPGGTKFGHNQIRLNDAGQFETFDLKYKQGDPSGLQSHANNAAASLNRLVDEFGLDTSGIAKGAGLGAVQYDPSTGRVRDATTAYNDIYNTYLRDQVSARIAGAKPPEPAPAPAVPAAAAPPPPLQYGQPPPPAPAPPPGPVDPATLPPNPFPQAPQGLGSLAPPPQAVPTFGTNPAATPDGAPGFQSPLTAVNNLPRGPAIGGQYAQATAAGDPFMRYRAPQYRTPPSGDLSDQASLGGSAYDQMGLGLLSRYGMGGGEHNFLPNRSTFAAVEAAKRYGQGSTVPQTEAEKAAAAVYATLRS